MKSTGIIRKIDPLGRLVLPKESRNLLGLPEGTPIEIYMDGQNIVLRKYQPGCVFCGEVLGLNEFKGKKICHSCFKQLTR